MNRHADFLFVTYYSFTLILLMTSISQNVKSNKEFPYYARGNDVNLLSQVPCSNGTDWNIFCYQRNIENTTSCDDYDSCGETICDLLVDNPNITLSVYFEPSWAGFYDVDKSHYCHQHWITKFKWTEGIIFWLIACIISIISCAVSYWTYKTSNIKVYNILLMTILIQQFSVIFSFPWSNQSHIIFTLDIVMICIYFLNGMYYLRVSKDVFYQITVYDQL